jgi:CubicO group peptidase (beta-lactamase class C family)
MEACTLSARRHQEIIMTYLWLLLHLFWALLALAPVLAQAAGPAPDAGRITTPAPRRPDAGQLATLLTTFEDYAEQARMAWGTPGMAMAIVHRDEVIYAKGFGVKKLGGVDLVDPHSLPDRLHLEGLHFRSHSAAGG